MYKPTLALVFVLSLLVPSLPTADIKVRVLSQPIAPSDPPILHTNKSPFLSHSPLCHTSKLTTSPSAQLLPRQAGANGATAQLSLLSTIDQSSMMSASSDSGMSSMATTTMTGSMSSAVPASASASISNSMLSAFASVAASMANSLATNAATGGGSGSGAQGVGNTGAAGGRVGVSWAWMGALAVVMGTAAIL
ncbi:hypothetical protein MMC27_008533 [Xylographa pallens]|nr:hypothetical protein [Xylographa pallens]